MRGLTLLLALALAACGDDPSCAMVAPNRGADRFVAPPLPANPLYWFDSVDINGDGVDGAGLAHGGKIATWVNRGTLRDNCVPTSGTTYQPLNFTRGIGTRDSVAFDGVADHCLFDAAKTNTSFIENTGVFTAVVLFRKDRQHGGGALLCSSETNTDKGFCIYELANLKMQVAVWNGTGSPTVNVATTATYAPGTWGLIEVKGDGVNYNISNDLVTFQTAALGALTSGAATNPLGVGSSAAQTNPFDGHVAAVMLWNRALSTTEEANLKSFLEYRYDYPKSVRPTIKVACLGDSLTQTNLAYADIGWPMKLELDLGGGYAVSNNGVSGEQTTSILNRWRSDIKADGYNEIIVLGGVNDLANGGTNATVLTNLQAIYTEAAADGLTKIVGVTMSPWKGYVGGTNGYTTTTQTYTDNLRTSIMAQAGITKLDLYASFGDADPQSLLAAYNAGIGDHLHWNNTGSDAMEALALPLLQ